MAEVSHFDAYRWATKGGAELLGREDIGTIEVGKAADLAIFKLDELRFSGAHDPLAALLLCGAHQADAVMVNGQWRVRDGELVDQDQKEIMEQHMRAAEKIAGSALISDRTGHA